MNALQSMAGALLGLGEMAPALGRFNEAITIGLQLNAEAEVLALMVLGAKLLHARGQSKEAAQLLVSIKRNPAASAFAVNSIEAALKELPTEVTASAEESSESWSLEQMTAAIRQTARDSA
jgi:hypothetical protein